MRPPEVEALCRVIVPGQSAVAIEHLGSGLLSDTYRVARDGADYTLKLGSERARELGADLDWEARLLNEAAAAGLAPTVVHADLERKALLTRWVAGRAWSNEIAKSPGAMNRIAALLHRVHGLPVPAPPRRITPQRWCDLYGEALAVRGLDADGAELAAAAAGRLAELLPLAPAAYVVCHSDLHVLNLIEENDSLILLDWEYAHIADPLWDIAGWSANNDLETQAQWQLLTCYSGQTPAPDDWRRLRLNLWLYDYVCLLWSRVYLGAHLGAAGAIAERARLLDARLRLPANYAA